MNTMDADQVARTKDNHDTVLIDVLGSESYRTRHIPGAHNIPADDADFDHKVQELVPEKDTNVIVYCADQDCDASQKAARRLMELGYIHVYEFEEGIKGWRQAGLEMSGEPEQIQTR